MLIRIKQYLCNHDRIETKSETGLNEIDQGYFFVKTLISCTKCNKSFVQHPLMTYCYVMHLQYEMIREAIFNKTINQIKEAKQ